VRKGGIGGGVLFKKSSHQHLSLKVIEGKGRISTFVILGRKRPDKRVRDKGQTGVPMISVQEGLASFVKEKGSKRVTNLREGKDLNRGGNLFQSDEKNRGKKTALASVIGQKGTSKWPRSVSLGKKEIKIPERGDSDRIDWPEWTEGKGNRGLPEPELLLG